MGLYGSEFWTYSLPRRVGPETAERLMSQALPVSAESAAALGLVDRLAPAASQEFGAEAERTAVAPGCRTGPGPTDHREGGCTRADEAARPPAEYRQAEPARMHDIVFDPSARYHALRSAFVRKAPCGSARPLSPVAEV